MPTDHADHSRLSNPDALSAIATDEVKHNLSDDPTFFSDQLLDDIRDTEEACDRCPVPLIEAFPKPDEGKYVAIFDELTKQWAARRNGSAQQIVQRDTEMVGEC